MTPAVHADRLRGALWGMFVGDALAMPVHWYCYIEHSFPAVLYLAARYPDDFEAALVANTNVGGDNCHRGAVLGAMLGAALGLSGHSRALDLGPGKPSRTGGGN